MMTPSEFTGYLAEWDHASKQRRVKILTSFISENNGKTAPELEQYLCDCASLFFTRLTAWLRLSYMNSMDIHIQLEAIFLFLSSSNGQKYIEELIEVGGILTLLEIIGQQHTPEEDKSLALHLILTICNNGRKYKELICESFGIRAVTECLGKSKSIDCRDNCRNVLQEFATGNPVYQQQVYKAMISLLKSSSPDAQQIAAQLLQYIQPMLSAPSINIVHPSLMLLRSLHVEVQYEATELIKLLMSHREVHQELLTGLINLLQPSKLQMQEQPEILTDPESPDFIPPYPVFVQQASAAKIIGLLSKESHDIANSCIRFGCIKYLLVAMGNDKHPDSQKQAGLTLQFFIHSFPDVESKVREALGQSFFFEYMNDPGSFHLNITPINLEILVANQVMVQLEGK